MNVTDEMVTAALAVLHERIGIVTYARSLDYIKPGMSDQERREALDALKAADAALLAAARSHVREALTAALSTVSDPSTIVVPPGSSVTVVGHVDRLDM